jgi:glutathione peroxidase
MNIYDIPLKTIQQENTTLAQYRGQVLLIVNVASKCGFTPQYQGMEALYQKYKTQGLQILGFPCDQFMHQEPGSDADIAAFCSTKYSVTFPMFAKVKVNGSDAHPLYQLLKKQRRGTLGTTSIKWNFTKFLVNRHGEVLARYGTATTPKKLDAIIAQTLTPQPSARAG